jgi:foldase protein PrsA
MSRIQSLILISLLALCAVSAAALAACGGDASVPNASAASDPVVLRVDGRPVRESAVEAIRAEFRLGGSSDARPRAEKEAVRRELLRREAERLGVKADPAEVESRRAAMVGQAGGEKALAQALKSARMTEDQLRRGLEDGVLHDAVQDAKFQDVSATVADARAYYDSHRAAFRREGSAHLYAIRVAAEPIAKSAMQRLREGRPFAEVARQFTTDAEAKADGGDMGVVALSSLPASFTDALKGVKSGEVVGPVQGPGGWYVLKATDLKEARIAPFSQVRGDLVKELTRRERFRALEKWLDAERGRTSVTRP